MLVYKLKCVCYGHDQILSCLYCSILDVMTIKVEGEGLTESIKKGGLLLIIGIDTICKGQV